MRVVGKDIFRYAATVAADGRIESLVEHPAEDADRTISPESSEGISILIAGRDILYRFDDDRRLRDLPYPDVLQAMQLEVQLTLHKVRHGELLDEPELVPLLQQLLVELKARAGAFQDACRRRCGGEHEVPRSRMD